MIVGLPAFRVFEVIKADPDSMDLPEFLERRVKRVTVSLVFRVRRVNRALLDPTALPDFQELKDRAARPDSPV